MTNFNSSDPLSEINYHSSILVDDDIINLCTKGFLIVDGFEINQVHQTCYDLRIGEKAYSFSTNEYINISEDKPLVLRQREVISISTFEAVYMLPGIAARIYSRVGLISGGISHTSTYVDPGFVGHLRISIVNHSNRHIELKYRDSFCKMEFVKLGKNVSRPYTGSHRNPDPKIPSNFHELNPRHISDEQILDVNFLQKELEFYGEPYDALFKIAIANIQKFQILDETLEGYLRRMEETAINVWRDEWTKEVKRKSIIAVSIIVPIVAAIVSAVITYILK